MRAAAATVPRLAAQFVQFYAMLQQRLAIRRIPAMHRWDIRGLQRVGQQAYRNPGIGTPGQVHEPRLARYEIGRNHDQFFADPRKLWRQLRGQEQLRVWLAFGQHLARRIPQRLIPCPYQLFAPDVHARVGLERHQLLIQRVVLLSGFLQRLFEAHAGVLQIPGRRFAAEELLDGFAQRAVPVLIETVPELLGHRPHAEHVDVSEIQIRLGIEVLVAQIASADDGHAVIRQPQLVVHPPVLQRQVEQSSGSPGHAGAAPQVQRIEQTDMDLRVRR